MPNRSCSACEVHRCGPGPASALDTETGQKVLGYPRSDHQGSAFRPQIAMATLIDASVLIAAERGQLDLETVLAPRVDEEFALASITASEMLHGVHRATRTEQRNRREVFVERLLATLPVIPFDLTAARVHARIGARLAGKGIAVGAHDLLIAATAIAAGARVATRDRRSFPQIPGLAILQW